MKYIHHRRRFRPGFHRCPSENESKPVPSQEKITLSRCHPGDEQDLSIKDSGPDHLANRSENESTGGSNA